MKTLSLIFAGLGVLTVVIAFIGRFHGAPSVTIFGVHSAASHIIIIGNTLLLIAIFLGQLKPPDKKP
jgi:hypothetical protein